MAETYQEKTEKPTEKRIEDARKKGHVAVSREIPASLVIIILSVFLYFSISRAFEQTFKFYTWMLGSSRLELDLETMRKIGGDSIYFWAKIMIPVFSVLVFVSVFGYIIQTGFVFSFERLKFNFQNLNPVEGIKRLLSKRSIFEVLKSIIKIAILAVFVFMFIRRELFHILSLTGSDPNHLLQYAGFQIFNLTLKLGILFLLLSGIDYLFQRWQYIKDLMMTRQELKEEYKEREGNPLVKSRIRAMQRALARKRMIEEVKKADVVITNPIHYAVALKYEMGKMPAPLVVAKGAGFIAEKIKQVAISNMVPVIENKILAQTLFFAVEVGDYIPEKFYLVVAEILAQVYRMKGRIVS